MVRGTTCSKRVHETWLNTTDIHTKSQNLRHLYPSMGLKLGVFRFFIIIKITAVHQMRMSPHLLWSESEDKTCVKHRMTCEDCGHIGFVFVFACMVRKNLKTPKLSPTADSAITLGGLEVWDLCYISVVNT